MNQEAMNVTIRIWIKALKSRFDALFEKIRKVIGILLTEYFSISSKNLFYRQGLPQNPSLEKVLIP